ncbi:hypothetical protein FQN54_005041 [Arachnomyces sp. PD_36]|nr:hypothetical protein FQN54_005041 [Arachnomyces sp. PD_36]
MFATKRLSKELLKVNSQTVPQPRRPPAHGILPRLCRTSRQPPYINMSNPRRSNPESETQLTVVQIQMQNQLPPGISIVSTDDFEKWEMDIQVLDSNPLYLDQIYRLRFHFSKSYPIEAPEVQFIQLPSTSPTPRPIPIHPHIYSNGIICLDLLGSAGWSPVQTVESVCMSIQSMLTGNSKNERPPGDEDFVARNRQRPRNINFLYDDNTV